MNILPLSQRDPRWKDIPLGFTSNTTIGSHGCTITCVSMLAGLTPDEVDQRLKDNGGYAQGNLIIWSRINAAIPALEWEFRGYNYDNSKVKAAIENYGACLVAVDGTPIGGNPKDGHWVLYIGNQQLIDPWDGVIKPTTAYRATGYSSIKVIKPPSPQPEPPSDVFSKFCKRHAIANFYEAARGKPAPSDEIDYWTESEQNIKQIFESALLSDIQIYYNIIQPKIEKYTRELEQLSQEIAKKDKYIEAVEITVKKREKKIGEMENEIKTLRENYAENADIVETLRLLVSKLKIWSK